MNIIQKAVRKGKDLALRRSETEILVRDATNNEQWGPSGTEMRQIADLTYSPNDYAEIMTTLWERIEDRGKNWRHVYKALLVFDYLLKNGSERVVQECRFRLLAIKTLSEFQFIDEEEKDVGLSVRQRAKAIVELLNDEKRLNSERETAAKNRDKFGKAISSESGYVQSSVYTRGSASSSSSTYGGYPGNYPGKSSTYDQDRYGNSNSMGSDRNNGNRSNNSSRSNNTRERNHNNGGNSYYDESSGSEEAAPKPQASPKRRNQSKQKEQKEQQQPQNDLLGGFGDFQSANSTSANDPNQIDFFNPRGNAAPAVNQQQQQQNFFAQPNQQQQQNFFAQSPNQQQNLFGQQNQQNLFGVQNQQQNQQMLQQQQQQQALYQQQQQMRAQQQQQQPMMQQQNFFAQPNQQQQQQQNLFSQPNQQQQNLFSQPNQPSQPKPVMDDEWNDFTGSSSKPQQQETSPKVLDSKDPWAKSGLIDLSSLGSSSNPTPQKTTAEPSLAQLQAQRQAQAQQQTYQSFSGQPAYGAQQQQQQGGFFF